FQPHHHHSAHPSSTMRFGTKKVYLCVNQLSQFIRNSERTNILPRPNHVITLLRNKHLPPTHAQFHVPLTFNKLDLKDYLFHLYNVEVRSVRSWVIAKNRSRRDPTTLNRRPDKYMTVELVKP